MDFIKPEIKGRRVKITVAIVAIGVALAVAGLATGGRFGLNHLAAVVSSTGPEVDPDADEDHDGLTNQREGELQTDPQNPDTDGDGYYDSVEVATGYDPLSDSPIKVASGPKTEIEEFFGKLGLVLGRDIEFEDWALPPVSNDEIRVSKDNSAAVLAEYSQTLSLILDMNAPVDALDYTLEIMSPYIEKYKEDQADFQVKISGEQAAKIALLRQTNQDMLDQLNSLSVPSSVVSTHKTTIGLLRMNAGLLDSFGRINDQPAVIVETLLRASVLDETLAVYLTNLEELMVNNQ